MSGVKAAIEKNKYKGIFSILECEPTEKHGYQITQKILKPSKLPLAIFAVNDITALGAIRALRDNNLNVPKDVAVLGFDDLSIANYIEPRLTTIHQPRFEMGKSGAELLIELVDRKKLGLLEQNIVLKPTLIIRNST